VSDTAPSITGPNIWRLLNWPNRISLFRLLLVAPFVLLLLHQADMPGARHGALAIFIVMSLSDVLDGMLARRMNCRTRLGAILDPLADKIMITCAVLILSRVLPDAPGAKLPSWLVVAVVGKDLWVTIGFLVIFMVTDKFRNLSVFWGKVSTLGQSMLIGLTLLAPEINHLHPQLGEWTVGGMSILVAGLCLLAAISYTRLGLSFIVTEEKPLDAATPPGDNPATETDR